ncbi:HepT-like ribonuclease domain-containing protein [Bradyrhizobium sp.]|uniref:HepT-like ribonuclease domain-containing protein n=1 Tax=Bradyrhizobium sp. TaxID=376 RepID=UPI004037EB24
MPPTTQDRLLDILEAISSIEKMIQGKNLDQFASDMMMRMATERLLEIVCEASRSLPDEIKKSEPTINWRKIIDFGNVLRHAYHAIRVDILWDIVQVDLPALKSFAARNIKRD